VRKWERMKERKRRTLLLDIETGADALKLYLVVI
jgi:hypothetical protein